MARCGLERSLSPVTIDLNQLPPLDSMSPSAPSDSAALVAPVKLLLSKHRNQDPLPRTMMIERFTPTMVKASCVCIPPLFQLFQFSQRVSPRPSTTSPAEGSSSKVGLSWLVKRPSSATMRHVT